MLQKLNGNVKTRRLQTANGHSTICKYAERENRSERQLEADQGDQGVCQPRVGVRMDDVLQIGLDVEPRGDRGPVRQLERHFGAVDGLSGLALPLDVWAAVVG